MPISTAKGPVASAIIALNAEMKTTKMNDATYADKMEDIILLAVSNATGTAAATGSLLDSNGLPCTGQAQI